MDDQYAADADLWDKMFENDPRACLYFLACDVQDQDASRWMIERFPYNSEEDKRALTYVLRDACADGDRAAVEWLIYHGATFDETRILICDLIADGQGQMAQFVNDTVGVSDYSVFKFNEWVQSNPLRLRAMSS